MEHLKSKITELVKRVQPEVQYLQTEESTDSRIELMFTCWRDDGILFQARDYDDDGEPVEDDDHPNFVGREKVIESLKKLGEEYSVSAWNHEKGSFSVRVELIEEQRVKKNKKEIVAKIKKNSNKK